MDSNVVRLRQNCNRKLEKIGHNGAKSPGKNSEKNHLK